MSLRITPLTLAVITAITLVASGRDAVAQPLPVVDGETIGTLELVKAACTEGQVTFYTAQSDADERTILKPFEKQFPCVKVSVISAVTGRLYERIQTEAQAGKVQADLAILTDEALVQKLIDGKLVRPWMSPLDAKYPPNAKDSGWWYAASGSLMYPIYNTDLVKAADAPKSWKDLLDPKWQGKLATSPVTIGGTAWMQYAFLREKFGSDYLVKLAAQQPALFTAYNPVVLAVARGESLVGITSALNEYPLRVGEGAPTAPVYPPEGLPFTNYPMVLLANAPHPGAGELFANWYLSRVGQAGLVTVRGAYSVRDDVPPAKGNPPLADARPWNPGHERIVKEHAALVTEATQVFGRR
jgi:iron(III) transport system substrate-binding protein